MNHHPSKLLVVLTLSFMSSGTHAQDPDPCQSEQYRLRGNANIEAIQADVSNGDKDAEYCLGAAYHDGSGVERNLEKAFFWYGKAAQKGQVDAQYWLCLMNQDGIGVPQNALEAIYWCKRAAKKNHPQALYALGNIYYSGHGRDKFTDYLNAYVWFSRAAAAGEDSASDMIDFLEGQMTDLQILEAKRIAERGMP